VDGVNLYAYCRGNPVILFDEDGRQAGDGTELISNNVEVQPIDEYIQYVKNLSIPENVRTIDDYKKWVFTSTLIGVGETTRDSQGRFTFNEEEAIVHEEVRRYLSEENYCPVDIINSKKHTSLIQIPFDTMDEAGKYAINLSNFLTKQKNKDIEYGGYIYEIERKFYITQPKEGCVGRTGYIPKALYGDLVSWYHTHGTSIKTEYQNFSPNDIKKSEEEEIVGYLGIPTKPNSILKFFPKESHIIPKGKKETKWVIKELNL